MLPHTLTQRSLIRTFTVSSPYDMDKIGGPYVKFMSNDKVVASFRMIDLWDHLKQVLLEVSQEHVVEDLSIELQRCVQEVTAANKAGREFYAFISKDHQ